MLGEMARVRCAQIFSRVVTYSNREGIVTKIERKSIQKLQKVLHLTYGTETWPMKVKHEEKFDRNGMSTNRWMFGFTQKRKKMQRLENHWDLEPVS